MEKRAVIVWLHYHEVGKLLPELQIIGNTDGLHDAVKMMQVCQTFGIPLDAEMYDTAFAHDNKKFGIKFSHPSFAQVPEGALIPSINFDPPLAGK